MMSVQETVKPDINVKAIRRMLKYSRSEFALQYGFAPDEIRAWETGQSSPKGAARTLLMLLELIPDEIQRALKVN